LKASDRSKEFPAGEHIATVSAVAKSFDLGPRIHPADTPSLRGYPGMPATVMIPTIQRTAFDYIAGPLVMSFNHSFRQK
jgi:hypothetical protein